MTRHQGERVRRESHITRPDAERIRAREQVKRLIATLHAIEVDIETRNCPPGINAAQAVIEAASSLAMTMAKLDAYLRAEDDQARAIAKLKERVKK